MKYVYICFLDGSVYRFTKRLDEDYQKHHRLIFVRVEKNEYR